MKNIYPKSKSEVRTILKGRDAFVHVQGTDAYYVRTRQRDVLGLFKHVGENRYNNDFSVYINEERKAAYFDFAPWSSAEHVGIPNGKTSNF